MELKCKNCEFQAFQSRRIREALKVILKRSLNKNQILILSEIQKGAGRSITSTLNCISRDSGISLSTLKLNAKILRELGLISYAEFRAVELTEFGEVIIDFLNR
ncbi:Uncharacterised protein [uncultured archaeon]|nr:Uncharacterised protein [uncultured archaeon]